MGASFLSRDGTLRLLQIVFCFNSARCALVFARPRDFTQYSASISKIFQEIFLTFSVANSNATVAKVWWNSADCYYLHSNDKKRCAMNHHLQQVWAIAQPVMIALIPVHNTPLRYTSGTWYFTHRPYPGEALRGRFLFFGFWDHADVLISPSYAASAWGNKGNILMPSFAGPNVADAAQLICLCIDERVIADELLFNKCKKLKQFKTPCKDDMVNSDN